MTPAHTYAAYFAALTPDSLEKLEQVAAANIRFVDPFNDVQGLERVKDVFRHMFRTTEQPRFTILDIAESAQATYLLWRFDFTPKGGRNAWQITGMSAVQFNEDGLATSHIDHWDAGSQFYAHLPVLGAVVRWVKRKMAA